MLLANANGASGEDADMKEMRDKTYTYMKIAVDEIRNVGQYVFWRDEDRKKGYVSAYHKRRPRRKDDTDQPGDNE